MCDARKEPVKMSHALLAKKLIKKNKPQNRLHQKEKAWSMYEYYVETNAAFTLQIYELTKIRILLESKNKRSADEKEMLRQVTLLLCCRHAMNEWLNYNKSHKLKPLGRAINWLENYKDEYDDIKKFYEEMKAIYIRLHTINEIKEIESEARELELQLYILQKEQKPLEETFLAIAISYDALAVEFEELKMPEKQLVALQIAKRYLQQISKMNAEQQKMLDMINGSIAELMGDSAKRIKFKS